MTWEEIIIEIRKDPAYKDLVELAYFEADLSLNVKRFQISEEFRETKTKIEQFIPKDKGLKLLDLGAGNGVASVSFALSGYDVTAVEPDPSSTVGYGAINLLKEHYKLDNLKVDNSFGEKLPFKDNVFDIVYIRQAMHHANHLEKFIKESARVLRKGGLLITVRDHVIFNEEDKDWFLEKHPLHRFYGGENAFTFEQYQTAMVKAGLEIKMVLRHYDSVINYFPEPKENVESRKRERKELVTGNLKKKLPGILAKNPLVIKMYERRLDKSLGKVNDENKIPGRMISFIAIKP